MKIKQHVMISNTASFRQGYYATCFTLVRPDIVESFTNDLAYIDCGEIELDISIGDDEVVTCIVNAIDAEIDKEQAEHHVKIELLKTRKSELLALAHDGKAT